MKLASGSAALGLISPAIVRAVQADHGVTFHTLSQGWEFLRVPLAGPWEAWSDQPLAPWSRVAMPHCFNDYDGCDPDAPAYRGKGWYRSHLDIANPFPNGRTLLHFEGTGQSSEIYIGAQLAGRHVGGYDEFVIDITDLLADPAVKDKDGIRLSVLCDNGPNMERIPSDLSDFTLYGGLYRYVHLVYVPAVSLEVVHIGSDVEVGGLASVNVRARLYHPTKAPASAASVQVDVTVTDPAGKIVYDVSKVQGVWDGMQQLADISVRHPKLWSPREPQLYQCRVRIQTEAGESVHVERFGLRFYEFKEHGPFFLNGERLLIRGTHRHADHAGYAAAMPPPLIRKEFELIKEMGANFIRLAHYQQDRIVLDLCDELGLLVWEEVPWCRAGVGDDAFQEQGREKLATMIDQHFNHPSIILWGLGNEDDWPGEYPSLDKAAIHSYMAELNALAHRLDSSRLTSYRRCDFARDVPDVYSPSIWAGWYGGRFVDYESTLDAQRKLSPRMLHTEWGADSHARRHAEDPYKTLADVGTGDTAERGLAYMAKGGSARVSRDGDWSETYACDLFDWHLKVQESSPWLAGAVQWIFKDFTTPLRIENPVPRVNQKGVVERDLTKKEGFYVFQSYWSEMPMAHIYGHSWPVRWGKPGQLRTIKVYSNCPLAELFVNGVSAGPRRRDIQNFPAAGLRWDVPFREGANTVRVEAVSASGVKVIDEISFLYQTAQWGPGTKLALNVIERTSDKVTVEAILLDANGVLCLDARNVLSFTLAGEGRLIDNQGTSRGSRTVQLYNGRARITVAKGSGKSVAGVTSGGVASSFCDI